MVKKEEKKIEKKARYIESVGRRKTAVARVRIVAGKGQVTINDKKVADYFTVPRFLSSATAPLSKLNLADKFDMSVKVSGGGPSAQAEAVRHGLSRALVTFDAELRHRLHKLGFLTRDPRMVERKKYGLKKARRAPQWAKR